MNMTGINTDAITTEGGLHLGNKDAPVKVVEFLNLRCPFSREWWENGGPVLDKYVEDDKVERIIKLYDKEKTGLSKGNVLHAHLNYDNVDQARKDMDYYTAHLDDWGDLPEEEVAAYAKEKREAERQENSREAEAIVAEAKEANVATVPTVVIEDYIFDQHITEEELKSIIETKLNRDEEREPNTF
ncbi:MAG: DsbA family protein [Alkalibacterium sp.]|nr:DsbA family protein [Alkalibacterium sp.]